MSETHLERTRTILATASAALSDPELNGHQRPTCERITKGLLDLRALIALESVDAAFQVDPTLGTAENTLARISLWHKVLSDHELPSMPENIERLARRLDVEPRYRLVRLSEIETSSPNYLVRDRIESGTTVAVIGAPSSFKSFLAVGLACSVATGSPWHDHEVEAGPVVYILGEGGRGIRRRFEAWSIRNGVGLADAPIFLSESPASLTDPDAMAEVEFSIERLALDCGDPSLIILDTLARNFGPENENDTQAMGAAIAAADRLKARRSSTILFVHHTGHADKTRARGAIAFHAALDSEYRVDRDDDGVVRMHTTKMKDAEEPMPLAFRPRTVELGFSDDHGHPVTSAVLDRIEYTQPETKRGSKGGNAGSGRNQRRAIAALMDLVSRQQSNVVASGRDQSEARVRVEDWREACAHDGLDRRAFHKVRRSLEANGTVSIDALFVELNDWGIQ